ncbi:hypothetical protein HN51_047358, partial [Arachis hypogaea]
SKNTNKVKGIALVTMTLQNPGPRPSILTAQVVPAAVEVLKVVLSIIKWIWTLRTCDYLLQGPTISPVFYKRDGKVIADYYNIVICAPKKALYKSIQQLRA